MVARDLVLAAAVSERSEKNTSWLDVEGAEVLLDQRQHGRRWPRRAPAAASAPRESSSSEWPCSFGQRRADRLQVVAGIEPGRDLADVLAQRLAVAQIGGAGQRIDLRAGIVDVVLARHLVAGELQQVGQRIAEHRAAAMADVHRPGRVGRDVLDVDALALAEIGAAVGGALLRGSPPPRGARRPARSVMLRKPGPATSTFSMSASRLQLLRQLVGDVARLHLGRLGQHHGGVAGEIAVRGIARRRHLDIGEDRARPAARPRACSACRAATMRRVHQRIDVHSSSPASAIPAPRAVGRAPG